MKPCTKFVSALSDAQRASLEQVCWQDATHRPRQRAQAVLLSAKGFTLEQLALMFEVHPETVSGWLDDWRDRGQGGPADASKSGRDRKIDAALEAELLDLLENPTPDLKAVVQAHLKKRSAGRLGHREALPAAAGLHLPPRPPQEQECLALELPQVRPRLYSEAGPLSCHPPTPRNARMVDKSPHSCQYIRTSVREKSHRGTKSSSVINNRLPSPEGAFAGGAGNSRALQGVDVMEDEVMANLDRVMRRETTLHRQIDTSVRMLGREPPRLFEGRVREDLLRRLGETGRTCQDPYLELWITEEMRRRPSLPTAPPSLDLSRLDTAPDFVTQICRNEPACDHCCSP